MNGNGELTGNVRTNYCDACECLDPDATNGEDNPDCPGSCQNSNWQGDGRCDDNNNNCGCEYDGGDCCEGTVMKNGELTGIVKTNFCDACECLDPSQQSGGGDTDCPGSCQNSNWQGDGRCDDGNNNCGCEYDGGDCCEGTVMKNGELTGIVKTNFCDACECLDPSQQSGGGDTD